MHIEDILDKLVGVGGWMIPGTTDFLSAQDSTMLISMDQQITRGNGFTEKQRVLAVRILKGYERHICTYLNTDISKNLDNPTFKLPLRQLATEKSVKVVTNENNTKILKVAFPYHEGWVAAIKSYRAAFNKSQITFNPFRSFEAIRWNDTTRTWDFMFQEEHVIWVYENFKNLGFEIEDDVVRFAEEIKEIENNMEKYVPMVVFEDGQFKYTNVCDQIPQPTSQDLLQVLFDAKKYGIYCWDEAIDLALDDKSISHVTRKVLRENLGKEIPQNGEQITLPDLVDTIKYNKTVLFVIPGGSELSSLKNCVEFLLNQGYTNNQMSVLFRLDSSAGAVCNEYVKTNQLNNPITDKIKLFFISGKVPKPLISSAEPIDVIINLGANSAHYTQRNLLKNHHSVINHYQGKVTGDKNFGNV